MKSTESLGDAGKLVDLSSATGETGMPGDTSIIENKRRRLVRGAVAFAPLVLTLRSGALAAASCTGAAKVAQTTLGAGATIPTTSPPVETGDGCFTRVTQCSTNASKLSTDPGTYEKIGNVSLDTSGKFYCVNGKQGETVAILSSASASSFRVN